MYPTCPIQRGGKPWCSEGWWHSNAEKMTTISGPLLRFQLRPWSNSTVALVFTLVTNLLLYGRIVSTTGQFTCNIKGPLNILNRSRCHGLRPSLTAPPYGVVPENINIPFLVSNPTTQSCWKFQFLFRLPFQVGSLLGSLPLKISIYCMYFFGVYFGTIHYYFVASTQGMLYIQKIFLQSYSS